MKPLDLEKAQIANKSTPMCESVALQKNIMEDYVLRLSAIFILWSHKEQSSWIFKH